MTLSRTPLRRGAAPKKRNPKRRQSEFARCYHSKERVAFVRALHCLVWYCAGQSQNHHIENGGAGRKANYDRIVPLCLLHHEQCHHIGRKSFERVYGLNLETVAAETEQLWLAHTQRSNDDAA